MSTKCFSDDMLRNAVASSISINEVLRKLKMQEWCGNWNTVKLHIIALKIDTSHFKGKSHMKGKPNKKVPKIPLTAILVKNSAYKNMFCLKRRLFKKNLLKNECCLCGQPSTWQGKHLMMVLDHINGDRSDHRIENLRMLCPNCNSQQITFAGRNRGK